MNYYFHNKFPSQLALLSFTRPSQIVREYIMKDDAVMFFGGKDWESAKTDLSRIPIDDRPKFVLALFMAVITDQCLYTHFNQTYQAWRAQTHFPKFGWSGFGAHNENPLKILWAPERDEVVSTADVTLIMPEFVSFMKSEVDSYFLNNLQGISSDAFFNAIRTDPAYSYSKGTVIPQFKRLIG